MPQNIGHMIAASCAAGVSYAERLLQGIDAADFGRCARPGGQIITANHPAFTFGHLSLYGPRIVAQLGGNADAVRLPAEFEPLFAKDATCQDDPDRTIYPQRDMIVDAFFSTCRAAIETLRNTDDAEFLKPNPIEGRPREMFPTLGAMHAFYVGGHLMAHLGQLSVWRRMMGLGPA